MADDLVAKVNGAIEEMRPFLQRSGADLQLVGMEDGIAHVVVDYGPRGYLLSNLSLVAGLERTLMERVPGLRGIVPVNLPPYSGIGWDKPSFAEKLATVDPKKLDGERSG